MSGWLCPDDHVLCGCVQVAFEEKLLVERYGAAYQDYQKSVKKFFPYLY